MLRPILHIAVDMQLKYLKPLPKQLPLRVNQFAADLHGYGVHTIWVAGNDEVNPPLLTSIDDIGMKLFWPQDQLNVVPNEGDLFCLKVGTSAFCNPHLDEYLAQFDNPLIIVTGVRIDACARTTIMDVVARGYECLVPLDLVAGVGNSKARYNSKIFRDDNEKVIFDIARKYPSCLLPPVDAAYVLSRISAQRKRPVSRGNRPSSLDYT